MMETLLALARPMTFSRLPPRLRAAAALGAGPLGDAKLRSRAACMWGGRESPRPVSPDHSVPSCAARICAFLTPLQCH